MQVVASLLMAADYFFDEDRREEINDKIKNFATGVQTIIIKDNQNVINEVFEKKFLIYIIGVCLALAAGAGAYLRNWIEPWSKEWVIPFSVALFLLSAGVFVIFFDLFIVLAPTILLSAPLWIFSKFVKYCKKGSIFGIGFLFLIASFVCRYLNLP